MRRLTVGSANGLSTRIGLEHARPWRIQTRCYLDPRPQGTIIQEGKGPMRKSVPTVELSDIALDLDAEDNPYVRTLRPEDVREQVSQWGYDPAIDEAIDLVGKLKASSKSGRRRLQQALSEPNHGRAISEHDVMTVALLGSSRVSNMWNGSLLSDGRWKPKSQRRKAGANMFSLMADSGIPRPILDLDANRMLPFILQRQESMLAALKDLSLRSERGTDGRNTIFQRDLRLPNTLDIPTLRRLCTHIDNPASGLDISAENIDRLRFQMRTTAQSAPGLDSFKKVLRIIHNLTIKRVAANKRPCCSLTLFGLQLSSLLGMLPCIMQYLQICLAMGFVTHDSKDVSITRSQAGWAILEALENGDGSARGTRPQIFSLLTGTMPGASEQQPALLTLHARRSGNVAETMETSVRLMGELGALRLLWHSWSRETTQEDVFVQAFLRCAQLLGGAKDGPVAVDITGTAGDREADALLDWQTVNALEASYIAGGRVVPKPALSTLKECISKQEVLDAFNCEPLSKAMARFRDLIDRTSALVPAAEDQPMAKDSLAEKAVRMDMLSETGAPGEAIPGGSPS